MNFEVVAGRIWGIDSGFGGAKRAAVYVVRNEFGWHLIDCAAASSVDCILRELEVLEVDRLASIMPTHVHLDHAGGAGELAAEFPKARVVAHPRAARHLVDPAMLIDGTRQVWGAKRFAALYGNTIAVPADRVDVVQDGDAAFGLEFFDAPGHARHHYIVWDAATQTVFAGDAFGIAYEGGPSFPSTSPVQFDPVATLATYEKIARLDPERICIAHFGVVTDLDKRRGELQNFLAQFLELAERQPTSTEDLLSLLAGDERTEWYRIDAELNAAGLNHWLATRNPVYSETS